MKRNNLVSWLLTMLISLGTFAGVIAAMGTFDVPVASTVATAHSTVAPGTSAASSSSLGSNAPVALASPPAGGADDASFATGSSTLSSFGSAPDS